MGEISAEKGRLNQDEIERMVKEAEEFAEEDRELRLNIQAKSNLEGYAYQMKNSVNDKDRWGTKISTEDKETIEEAVKESIDWLETNPDAKRMDYKEKLKELEEICDPIILKLRREDRKNKKDEKKREKEGEEV